MSIDLTAFGPIVDLVRGTASWSAEGQRCDLCRREEPLYRLINTTDALCRSCFGMWHG